MTMLAEQTDGVIGLDTHRDTLTAAAVTPVGGLLGQLAVPADGAGYQVSNSPWVPEFVDGCPSLPMGLDQRLWSGLTRPSRI